MAVKFRDYYEVLGVPRTATPDEIKRAYRQLARKNHPDVQPATERARAAERFKEINQAHEVLSDPEKRAKYDALGANWMSGMDFTPPPGGGFRGGATAGGESVSFEDLEGFSDFFSSIFGRGGSRSGARSDGRGVRITIPGNDVEAELPVTLDDLLRGGKRRIQVPGGKSLDVDIPLGMRDGAILRLAGQGEPGLNGGPPGDLYLRLRLAPHPRYRVVGDDLEMDLPLWPWQAVLGGDVKIDTPDGLVTLAATSPRWPSRASSIRSSAATRRSAASSRSSRAGPRTTRS